METIRVLVGKVSQDGSHIESTVQMTVTPEVLFHLARTREIFAGSGATPIRGQKVLYRFCDPPPGHYGFEFSQGYDGQLVDQPGLWMFFIREEKS